MQEEVAGYARQARNLMQVTVSNAGHLVPYDQPLWAFDMMRRFVEDKSFEGSYTWEQPLEDPSPADEPSEDTIQEKKRRHKKSAQ